MTREYARSPRGERAHGAIPRNAGTVTTMIGALVVHALVGGSPIAALVLLALMSFVAWGRRDRTIVLLRRWLGR